MTVRTGTLAWLPAILDADGIDPTETLLLVALADHVNADDECYVGIDVLAKRARVSYATARRRLAALTDRGLIVRSRRRRNDGNLSVYDFTLQREPFGLPPLNLSGDHSASNGAVTTAHQGERAEPPRDEPPRDEPLVLVDVKPSAPGIGETAAFEDFWSAYPRKTAKGQARRAWPTAVKAAGGDVDTIIEGAARYTADPNRDDRFTAHAATWLNGERWSDPPLPPRTGRPATTGPRAVVDPTEEARRRQQPAGRITDL